MRAVDPAACGDAYRLTSARNDELPKSSSAHTRRRFPARWLVSVPVIGDSVARRRGELSTPSGAFALAIRCACCHVAATPTPRERVADPQMRRDFNDGFIGGASREGAAMGAFNQATMRSLTDAIESGEDYSYAGCGSRRFTPAKMCHSLRTSLSSQASVHSSCSRHSGGARRSSG